MNGRSIGDFEGSETTLGGIIMGVNLLKSIGCRTQRVNPNVKAAFWMIMMCSCRFFNCNRSTRGGCACVGVGGIWDLSTILSILL